MTPPKRQPILDEIQVPCSATFTPINQSSSPLKADKIFEAALDAATQQCEVQLQGRNPFLAEHLGLDSDQIAPPLAELSPNAGFAGLKSAGVPASGIRRKRNRTPSPVKPHPGGHRGKEEDSNQTKTLSTKRPRKRVTRGQSSAGDLFQISKSTRLPSVDQSLATNDTDLETGQVSYLKLHVDSEASYEADRFGFDTQCQSDQTDTALDHLDLTLHSPLDFDRDQQWSGTEFPDDWSLDDAQDQHALLPSADHVMDSADDSLFDAFINFPPNSPRAVLVSNFCEEDFEASESEIYKDIDEKENVAPQQNTYPVPNFDEANGSTTIEIPDQDLLILLSDGLEAETFESQAKSTIEPNPACATAEQAAKATVHTEMSLTDLDNILEDDEAVKTEISTPISTIAKVTPSAVQRETTTSEECVLPTLRVVTAAIQATTTSPSASTPALDDSQPITRPPFPAPTPDRSPITGLSATMLLRTCFRVGEAINCSCDALRRGVIVVIELYARVVSSYREDAVIPADNDGKSGSGKQYFVFRDLFHEHPPFLEGCCEVWQDCGLWDDDSAVFLGDDGAGRMCRVVGRMKREQRQWRFVVLNIWEAGWDDLEFVRGIVCR